VDFSQRPVPQAVFHRDQGQDAPIGETQAEVIALTGLGQQKGPTTCRLK